MSDEQDRPKIRIEFTGPVFAITQRGDGSDEARVIPDELASEMVMQFDPVVDPETYLAMCPPSEVSIDAIGYHGERLSSVTTSELTPDGIELAARLAVKAANTEPKWNGER